MFSTVSDSSWRQGGISTPSNLQAMAGVQLRPLRGKLVWNVWQQSLFAGATRAQLAAFERRRAILMMLFVLILIHVLQFLQIPLPRWAGAFRCGLFRVLPVSDHAGDARQISLDAVGVERHALCGAPRLDILHVHGHITGAEALGNLVLGVDEVGGRSGGAVFSSNGVVGSKRPGVTLRGGLGRRPPRRRRASSMPVTCACSHARALRVALPFMASAPMPALTRIGKLNELLVFCCRCNSHVIVTGAIAPPVAVFGVFLA